jgi:DNA-binding CsgD family transcriptional regulator
MTRNASTKVGAARSDDADSQTSVSSTTQFSRIERLTKAQLEVLERVALRRTSKEIARELGVSPVTVDQRVKRAQSILGANNRSEAARILISARGAGWPTQSLVYDKTIYDSSGLFEPSNVSEQQPSAGEWNPAVGGDAEHLRQTQALYFSGLPDESAKRSLDTVLDEIRRPASLTPATKTIIIIAIMIFTLVAFAMLVSLAEGLSRII